MLYYKKILGLQKRSKSACIPKYTTIFRYMMYMFYLDVTKVDMVLHILQWLYICVASVCFKCFSCFKRMLQVFYLDAAYVEWPYTYVASVCFKYFSYFKCICCKCFIWMLHMLQWSYTCVARTMF